MFEEMIKEFLQLLIKTDGEVYFQHVHSNMFAGMTRKHRVVVNRILKISPVGAPLHVVGELDTEHKRISGEYSTISQLVKLGLLRQEKGAGS